MLANWLTGSSEAPAVAIADQADRLRQLVRETRRARTLAVCSGKGGVGKSNVCLNLAVLLSAAGSRVALIDADLGLANLDILMDLDVRTNLSHVIEGTRTLDDVLVELPSGVQFVPGACGLANLLDLSEFQHRRMVEELTRLEADNDVILIDCGAGIGKNVMRFATAADQVVVITSPEPTAMTDAYAVIKVLHQREYAGEMGVLVNMASGRSEARATYHRLADVVGRFLGSELEHVGYVLSDSKVTDAVRLRQPFVLAYPRCLASRCLAAVANRISRYGVLAEQAERKGFFRRVVNWFG